MGKFMDELAPKFADSSEPTLADFKHKTIAWVIQKYLDDMPSIKPLGASHIYILRAVQRSALGKKSAVTLKRSDVIDYCKLRRTQKVVRAQRLVTAPTVNQELSYLVGAIKYVGSAAEGCEDITATVIKDTKPMLVKLGLIGKSKPRTRVPTDEELERLFAYFKERAGRSRVKISYAPVILFALASTRRLGEICRMQHGDIDWQNPAGPMYTIRDVKHPTKKQGNHKTFAMLEPMPEIIRMQPRLTEDPTERVFPFNSKSLSQGYAIAKRKLGINGLRFHDNRREAITRWLAKFKNPHKVKLISGHETTQILERVYDATDPATLHGEVAALQRAAA